MSGLPFGGYWIVCDMDSTVLERPTSGLFPTLKEGPCFDAMMEWVEGGGSVLLNTTATFRSLAQFWECFPLKYRKLGQVMMSLASGATLVYYHESGKLLGHGKFDEAYMEQEGGQKKTWMEQEIIDKIIDEILPIIQQLHWDMANNHELIELLSLKFHTPMKKHCENVLREGKGFVTGSCRCSTCCWMSLLTQETPKRCVVVFHYV
eukprot:m.80576 g.80576  ORF g.80576 m.80576 type:complete len:206 (-) comp8625_c0_seq4:124-741(-)